MKIGIIGAGNMAGAIAGRLCKVIPATDIFMSDKDKTKLEEFEKMGINTGSNIEAASFGDVLILAVKPNVYSAVLQEIAGKTSKTVISIAAGISIDFVQSYLKGINVIRVMPNTPALVGCAMTAICANDDVCEEELKKAEEIFAILGKTVIVKESLMDAVVSVSGSSPAYVFMMIEAMADAAVSQGLTRDDAIMMAAQACMGAAKMVLETKIHPAKLKDMVCSPGGTTIDAVKKLEETGFRSSVIEAMQACFEKSKKMSK